MDDVLKQLSADGPNRGLMRYKGEHLICGGMLPDLGSPTPPDVPPAVATPRLRVVGGKAEAPER